MLLKSEKCNYKSENELAIVALRDEVLSVNVNFIGYVPKGVQDGNSNYCTFDIIRNHFYASDTFGELYFELTFIVSSLKQL